MSFDGEILLGVRVDTTVGETGGKSTTVTNSELVDRSEERR